MLHEKLKKLMEMKKGSKMEPMEKDAKASMLKALKDEMSGMMGSKLNGLKKVTVASDTPEGLEHGLDKAKDILGHTEEMGHEEDAGMDHTDLPAEDDISDMHDEAEGMMPDEHEGEDSDGDMLEPEMSDEDIDAKIAELMAKKGMKKK